jgi:hypothetical protein
LELEHLKNQPDYQSRACLASDHFIQICSEGQINQGVFRQAVGWFISPPLPPKLDLENELAKVALLTRSLGRLNTQLILLGREIKQKVPTLSVVLVTRDHQVYNTLQLIDIQSHLFAGFPLKLDTQTLQPAAPPDWNEVLRIIQIEAERNQAVLSLTLTKKSTPPAWLILPRHQLTLIAEGKGRLHSIVDYHFTWTLLFEPWDFPYTSIKESSPEPAVSPVEFKPGDEDWMPGKVHLELEGATNSIPAYLHKTVVRTILRCASPMAYIEDLPTLQEPVSILKQFLIFEYAFQERKLHGDIRPEDFSEMETRLRDPDNLLNWAYFWLRERQSKTQEIDISLREFLSAIRSCWNIGETIDIDISTLQPELANPEDQAQE